MRYRSGTSDGLKIAAGLAVFVAALATGGWLLARDVHDTGYDATSADGNTVWLVGVVAVAALAYTLWIVFRDVEEFVEREVHEHADDLRHLERFEPTVFRWALAACVVAVLIVMILT
ncbi:MAG TPA: hypothetical protein PLV13_11005 [Ilumatobacteraceae bacterium]|nr:hypothetical protein [Ilumatobacteraceae bacterium]